jgi:lambda family phage minor tail protein L
MDNRNLVFNNVEQLKEDALIDLFTIDGDTAFQSSGFSTLYLVSPEQSGGQTVQYVNKDGNLRTYKPVPIAFGGVEITGSNKLPTPKLFIGNIDGGMTDLSRDYDDLIGFRLVRIRTYKKYLFKIGSSSQSTSSGSAHFTPEIWYFNRKEQETKLGVNYQLASVFDIEGLSIPRRRMYPNFCPFAYRGPDCQYAGSNVPTAGEADGCAKTLEACKQHFGANNNLRFGGFPTVQN